MNFNNVTLASIPREFLRNISQELIDKDIREYVERQKREMAPGNEKVSHIAIVADIILKSPSENFKQMMNSYMKTENDIEEKLKNFTIGTRSKSIENILSRIFPEEKKEPYINTQQPKMSPPKSIEDQSPGSRIRKVRTMQARLNPKPTSAFYQSEHAESKKSWNRVQKIANNSATMLIGPHLDREISGKLSGNTTGSKASPSVHGSNLKVLNNMTIHHSPK